jgi:glycerol-3-phosphate dehydrogenase
VSTPLEDRRARRAKLAAGSFDVVIIGGGITGAGIARDAAMRGLRTAILERDDYASGTSSRSSRLVHGGVRYLEHGHLHLVFESSRERRILLRIAPHLVRPLQFTWPVYRGARVPRWKLAAGLLLYDALAAFRNVGTHRRLNTSAVLAQEPALAPDGLLGGATYYDAATNDARLTLANIRAAEQSGAVALNHAPVVAIERSGGRATGVRVRDAIDGVEFRVTATVVVNATGPWSDEVRGLDAAEANHAVRGTKGVHLAVPAARVGNRGALTLLSPLDGRVTFVLPSESATIIGTTDTATTESPDTVRASNEDVDYLLRTVNAVFPRARLERHDVIAAWAGIRPLIAAGFTENPASASREHTIDRSPSGILTITGGKLTTYRAMATEMTDRIETELRRPRTRARTAAVALPGGEIASLEAESREAGDAFGAEDVGRHLATAYGCEWREVRARVERDPALRERLTPELPCVLAELGHAVEHEHAVTLADLLIRRTHVAFESADGGRGAARRAAGIVAPLLGWDASRQARELEAYDADVSRIFGDPLTARR